MEKFYCNVCEEYMTLKNGKCPKCKTDWKKIINENQTSNNSKAVKFDEEDDLIDNIITEDYHSTAYITKADINKNINFFLTWATIGKIILIIYALIIGVIAFVKMDETDGGSLILILIAIGAIIIAIIFENQLKWKAYMLYTNSKKRK